MGELNAEVPTVSLLRLRVASATERDRIVLLRLGKCKYVSWI